MIDLISDTVTLPSAAMLGSILNAPLGDAGRLDGRGRGEDPTTNALEDLAAELMGKEAALFFPTGTLANTCAVLTHCPAGSRVLVEERQHILVSEKICFRADGFRMEAATYRLQEDGSLDAEAIRQILQTQPIALVCLENTHNYSGGKCILPDSMKAVQALCRERGIPVHLDGARIFNAAEALGLAPKEIAACCDSVMFCVSKGLGAPIGSLLCGTAAWIEKARAWRRLLGGTMRQSGVAAACGIYALQHNIPGLAEDRRHAQQLSGLLRDLKRIRVDPAPHSNILLLDLSAAGIYGKRFCAMLQERGVRGSVVSPEEVRLVFHAGITAEDVPAAAKAVREIDGLCAAGLSQ
jgi:threonine aldolase